jgi:hypothetical protein
MDFYSKAHLLLRTIEYLGFEERFKEFVDILKIMECELLKVISYAETNKLTTEKYIKYAEAFVHEDNCEKNLKELKELLKAYQTINDSESIKSLERLFIQLLGHFNVYIALHSVILGIKL